jgi:hypothetical protein
MLSKPSIQLVAVDDGYDFTKVVARSSHARIPTTYCVNPGHKVAAMGTGKEPGNVYEIEGDRYGVDPNAPGCDTRFEEFPFHPANLAVAMDAIRRVVAPASAVHVIAGLPFNRFYLPTGQVNQSALSKKASAWSRLVRPINGAPLPRIEKVSLIAESVAAWFDFVIDQNFQIRHDVVNDCMAVVDIGGRTTDITVFQNGQVSMEYSGTLDTGALEIQKKVSDALSVRFPGTKFPRSMLIDSVSLGKLPIGGGEFDVSEEVLEGKRFLATNIELFMKTRFGSQMPLMTRVLFVGGGAHALYFELKKRFPNAEFAKDGQMANARGMYKYGVSIANFDEIPQV